MMLPPRGWRIWARTTPALSLSPQPVSRKALSRAFTNAASRLGPLVPLVPARWSVWQLPHVAAPTNSFLPLTRSAFEGLTLEGPQPEAARTTATATPAAHIGRQFL